MQLITIPLRFIYSDFLATLTSSDTLPKPEGGVNLA